MMMVVMQSSDAVKQALVEGSGLKIFGDWLLAAADAVHTGRAGERQIASSGAAIAGTP